MCVTTLSVTLAQYLKKGTLTIATRADATNQLPRELPRDPMEILALLLSSVYPPYVFCSNLPSDSSVPVTPENLVVHLGDLCEAEALPQDTWSPSCASRVSGVTLPLESYCGSPLTGTRRGTKAPKGPGPGTY